MPRSNRATFPTPTPISAPPRAISASPRAPASTSVSRSSSIGIGVITASSLFGPLAATALLAAAPQADPGEIAALKSLGAADTRIARIAYRLQTSSAALCPRKSPLLGLAVHSLAQYPSRLRQAAREAFGLGDIPGVLAAVEGSPAATLRGGDRLLAVEGLATLPEPPTGPARHAPTAALEKRLEAAAADGRVRLDIERGGKRRAVDLTPVQGCASRPQLVQSKRVRASADGTYVTITTALLNFVRNDDELAFALAHEIAHNALGHRQAIDRTAAGKARDALERRTEFAADRLAIAMLRASGYEPARALVFLDRLFAKVAQRRPGKRHLGRDERLRHARAVIASLPPGRRLADPDDF